MLNIRTPPKSLTQYLDLTVLVMEQPLQITLSIHLYARASIYLL